MHEGPVVACCVWECDDLVEVCFDESSVSQISCSHGHQWWCDRCWASWREHPVLQVLLLAVDVVALDSGADFVHHESIVVCEVLLGVVVMVDLDAVHVGEVSVRKPRV